MASDVSLAPIGRAVTDFQIDDAGKRVKDGYVIGVYVINRGDYDVILPSKGLGPSINPAGDQIRISYGFRPDTLGTRSGQYNIVPPMERFGPVTLKKGECVLLEPLPVTIEKDVVARRTIVVSFRTSGFLSERLGFTAVELEAELLLLGPRSLQSDVIP
jgi:hypothetical protein